MNCFDRGENFANQREGVGVRMTNDGIDEERRDLFFRLVGRKNPLVDPGEILEASDAIPRPPGWPSKSGFIELMSARLRLLDFNDTIFDTMNGEYT